VVALLKVALVNFTLNEYMMMMMMMSLMEKEEHQLLTAVLRLK